ncbi:MAG: hypothetical protein L6R42_006297 [Xanthoria sp. 1 TBL-2021]|nr:MAG: hypothetical protein L6R42_006297 [Xanthoria sp. 1 TBL-2021]
MHSFSIVLFAAGALAGNLKLNQILPRELQVRQSEAFQPTTSFGSGATCADAFGSGYIDCNGVCYNPNEDQTCCPGNGDGYPCPSESFCLNVGGLCCPDGLDAATCAAQNGVSLPADYNSATSAISGSTTVASSTVSAVESTITDTSSAFVPSTTATTIATPYPTTGNATVHPGTGVAPTGTGAGGSPVPFTGSASNVKVGGAGLAAGFLGVVAMLL